MPLFEPPNVKELKTKGDVKGLVKALRYKKDHKVPMAAAEALGQIGDAQVVEPLISALKNKDKAVRKKVAEALERIGAPAVERLIAAVESSNSLSRPDHGVASILLKLNDPRARKAINRYYELAADEKFLQLMHTPWEE